MTEQARVLVVDDDADILALITAIVKSAGYEVQSLNSGSEALQKLRQKKIKPQVIVMDIEMPGMSGYEVCEALQEDADLALIPVIMVTANSQAESRLQAFQMGAVGFLTKPLSNNLLLDQIAKALEVWKQWGSHFEASSSVPASPPKEAENSKSLPVPQPAELPSELPNVAPKTQPVTEVKVKSQPSNTEVTTFSKPGEQKVSFAGFVRLLSSHLDRDLAATATTENLYELANTHGVTARHLAGMVSQYTGLPLMSDIPTSRLRLGVLPMPFCRKYHVVPFQTEDQVLGFAMTHPFTMEVEDALRSHRNAPRFIVAPEVVQRLFNEAQNTAVSRPKAAKHTDQREEMHDLMDELQTQYQPDSSPIEELEVNDYASAPMIRLVNRLITEAIQVQASDIHIEAWEEAVAVRYRVDGVLKDYHVLKPPQLIQALAARIKIMADLNIAERRLPQDGRIVFKKYNRNGLDYDLRVATSPMNFGEKIVMRIIDKQKSMLPLDSLGFSERNLELYRTLIRSPYGMVLHVGPTGSGKSMTLYSALNEINRPEINIQTAEDPIEYTLPRINQLQVQSEIGLTFARALRAYLRQDPDVILVGEIRDPETAHTAIEAALTGHLLLSTLHTNDAASTLTRFIEMGIAPFMVSPSVLMICAQRLLRKLCEHCREPYTPSISEKQQLGLESSNNLLLYQPGGCEKCQGTGYRGRTGIHELLIPTERLRLALAEPGMTAEKLKKIAVQAGMVTLYWDAMTKVKAGITSLKEALVHVKPDEFDSKPLGF